MKREYMEPDMKVVVLHHKCNLLTGSDEVRAVSTNFEDDDDCFQWGGGGNDNAR